MYVVFWHEQIVAYLGIGFLYDFFNLDFIGYGPSFPTKSTYSKCKFKVHSFGVF